MFSFMLHASLYYLIPQYTHPSLSFNNLVYSLSGDVENISYLLE